MNDRVDHLVQRVGRFEEALIGQSLAKARTDPSALLGH
jgi:hypothetical protein